MKTPLALIERHKKKGVPRTVVKVLANQILLGLSYLHDECDLVHTDIKPENIRECLCYCSAVSLIPSPVISIPGIESRIQAELTLCPSPTSRTYHVFLRYGSGSDGSTSHTSRF